MDDENTERWAAAEEGIERLQEGDIEGAIEELLRVVQAEPSNEYAHCFLGNAFYEQGRWEKALRCYVSALGVAPRYLGALTGAGHCLRFLGEHEKAIRMGRQILAIDKDDPDGLYLLGTVFFQRGENAAARGYLETFLLTSPEAEVAIEVEGMLEIIRGNLGELPTPEDD
ncbi:MAG: tetratricopeptide repeat protein [Myxococcales bacterium]|nr:tetratricopeptide repeat protein [Myxococcales bacterium]